MNRVKISLVIWSILWLAGCATKKEFTAIGGNKAGGTVTLGYDYGGIEKPVIDLYQANAVAQKKCESFGFDRAEPFGGTTEHCIFPGGYTGCQRFQVTMEYQCLSN